MKVYAKLVAMAVVTLVLVTSFVSCTKSIVSDIDDVVSDIDDALEVQLKLNCTCRHLYKRGQSSDGYPDYSGNNDIYIGVDHDGCRVCGLDIAYCYPTSYKKYVED